MFKSILQRGKKSVDQARQEGGRNSETEAARPLRLECESLPEYLACILDLEQLTHLQGRPVFPVLSALQPTAAESTEPPELDGSRYSRSSSFETLAELSLEELLRHCLQSASFPVGKARARSCCLLAGRGEYALLGAAYGIATRRSLLHVPRLQQASDLPTALEDFDEVLVFLTPDELAHPETGAIWERLDGPARGEPRRWGIMTASDSRRLSQLLARIRLLPPAEPLGRIYDFHRFQTGLFPEDPELQQMQAASDNRGLKEETGTDAAPLLILRGHGNQFCFSLGALCAGSRARDPEDHRCVQGMHCKLHDDLPGWELTPVERLRSRVVVFDSCYSASFTTQLDPGRSLALHLLDGRATAVLAPCRINEFYALTPYVLWAYLRMGMTLGEAARALSNVLSKDRNACTPFLLFGDPDATPFACEKRAPAVLEVVRGKHGWQAELPGTTSCVSLFRCIDAELLSCAARSKPCFLPGDPAQGHPIFELLPPDHEGHQDLLVVWNGTPPDRSYPVNIVTAAPFRRSTFLAAKELMGECLQNLVQLGLNPSLSQSPTPEQDPSASAAAQELESLLHSSEPSLAHGVSQSVRTSEDYRRLAAIEEQILERSREATEELLEAFSGACGYSSTVLGVFDLARGARLQGTERTSCACPECAQPLVATSYAVGVWPCQERRQWECDRCNLICDFEAPRILARLHGPSALVRGSSHEYQLVGFNDSTLPAFVGCRLAVKKRPTDACGFEVGALEGPSWIGPGEEFAFRCSLGPAKELPPHGYRLQAFLSLNGKLGFVLRRLRVL